MTMTAPQNFAFSPAAAAAGAPAGSAQHPSAHGAYGANSTYAAPPQSVTLDLRDVMRRLQGVAMRLAVASGAAAVEAARLAKEIVKAMCELMMRILRFFGRMFRTQVNATGGQQLEERTDADPASNKPPGASAADGEIHGDRGPGRTRMGLAAGLDHIDEGLNLGPGQEAPAGDPLFSMEGEIPAAQHGFLASGGRDVVVPAETIQGYLTEKADEIVEHFTQDGRVPLPLLADPETASEWVALSLNEWESVRGFLDQDLHRRREQLEQIVSRIAVSENRPPEVVQRMLDSETAGLLDPSGEYRAAQDVIRKTLLRQQEINTVIKAILGMPAAQGVPQEQRDRLSALVGLPVDPVEDSPPQDASQAPAQAVAKIDSAGAGGALDSDRPEGPGADESEAPEAPATPVGTMAPGASATMGLTANAGEKAAAAAQIEGLQPANPYRMAVVSSSHVEPGSTRVGSGGGVLPRSPLLRVVGATESQTTRERQAEGHDATRPRDQPRA